MWSNFKESEEFSKSGDGMIASSTKTSFNHVSSLCTPNRKARRSCCVSLELFMTKRKLSKSQKSEVSLDSTAAPDNDNTSAGDIDTLGSQGKDWWGGKWWKLFLSSSENSFHESELFEDDNGGVPSNQSSSSSVPSAPTEEIDSIFSTSNSLNHRATRASRSSSFSSNSVPFRDSSTPSSSFSALLSHYFEVIVTHYRLRYLEGDNDLYYTLRTQPFSSGIYLRGMLIAGFSNTLFHLYDYALLAPPPSFPSFYHLTIYRITVAFLLFHILLNFLSIPTRVMLHYQCWKNSHVIDSESASIALQDLLSSNIWIFNRILAWSLDTISLTTLVCGQLYLWNDSNNETSSLTSPSSCPYLTSLIYNICATNILSFLIRSLVGAMYLLSFREFREGSGVRNRGMSNFDLDRIEKFTFTSNSAEELSSPECSICLQAYETNDLLLRLPCHARHCFHAECIREWLKRQNACPLCQKIC